MDYYILASDIASTTKIASCKFFKQNQISADADKVIRVSIPDSVKMIKEKDHKVIKNSAKTINDVTHDVMIKFDGEWKVRNDLGLPLLEAQNKLVKEGYHFSYNGFIKWKGVKL